MAGRPRRGHNRALHEARKEVERRRSATPLQIDPIDALQEVLDAATADLRHAQSRVDELQGGELWRRTAYGDVPNEWIRLRDKYRAELERICTNLVRTGIAERVVNVRIAEAALVVQSVQAAAIDAGISPDQVRALGAALRRRVEQPAAPAAPTAVIEAESRA